MATQPPNQPYLNNQQLKAQQRAQREYYRQQQRIARDYRYAAHRGSVVGPVLAVAFGVIFLLGTTHHLDLPRFFRGYAHWWPLLLIVAGLVHLLEWAIQSRNPAVGTLPDGRVVPIPRSSRIGAGTVWLIILIIAIGFSVSHMGNWNWHALDGNWMVNGDDDDLSNLFGNKHTADQELAQAIPVGSSVTIQNSRGDITVASGTDDQMHITLHKAVYTSNDGEAKRRLERMAPQVTTGGAVTTVRLDPGENSSGALVITLPAGTVVDAHANHGDVTVSGMNAPVTAAADHGDIKLDSIKGTVHGRMSKGDFSAHSITGDVTIEGHMNDVTLSEITGRVNLDGDFFGDSHFERISGPLHLHSSRTDFEVAKLDGTFTLDSNDLTADRVLGPVKLSSRSKNIELNQVSGDMTVQDSGGNINVSSSLPLGNVDVVNRHGDVKVAVPENAGFNADLTASPGDIETDFGLSKTSSEDHGTVTGTVGGGGSRVRVSTDHGDIELRKAAAVEAPAMPAPNVAGPQPPPPPKIAVPKPPKVPKIHPPRTEPGDNSGDETE